MRMLWIFDRVQSRYNLFRQNFRFARFIFCTPQRSYSTANGSFGIEIVRVVKNPYGFILHVVVVVLCIEVAILSRQNSLLKKSQGGTAPELLQAGDHFALKGLRAATEESVLDSTRETQLVFVLTTTCPFCREMIPVWNELASRARHRVGVIAVCLDSLERAKKFAHENRISYPLFVPNNVQEFRKLNKAYGVPKTLIRQKDGSVRNVWNGKLTVDQLREVAKTLSLY